MRSLIFGVIVLLLFCTSAEARDANYYQKITHKLGRGCENLFGCTIEMFRSAEKAHDRYGKPSSFIGAFHGIGKVIVRALNGVYDIVTFPVGIPHFDTVLMDPEFVTDNFNSKRYSAPSY
ncbi:MAG: hypothetical protein KKH94_10460 [Candidatus Omnitrophica bacterium]|nr:hypothetical protein [Candidatus Omnitrophota bacterium]